MSTREFIEWSVYDEMTGIMAETKQLDSALPDYAVIEMTIEHQNRHDWVGRVDPNKRRPPKPG